MRELRSEWKRNSDDNLILFIWKSRPIAKVLPSGESWKYRCWGFIWKCLKWQEEIPIFIDNNYGDSYGTYGSESVRCIIGTRPLDFFVPSLNFFTTWHRENFLHILKIFTNIFVHWNNWKLTWASTSNLSWNQKTIKFMCKL